MTAWRRVACRSLRAMPAGLPCCCVRIPPWRPVPPPPAGRCPRHPARPTSSAGSATRSSHCLSPRTAAARVAVGSSPGITMSTSSSRHYLSVWLRRLPTDRIARRLSAPADAPLAIVASIDQALRITALNDAAARLRLKSGMALADARAMYPSLPVADADAEADQRLLIAIADWCD